MGEPGVILQYQRASGKRIKHIQTVTLGSFDWSAYNIEAMLLQYNGEGRIGARTVVALMERQCQSSM